MGRVEKSSWKANVPITTDEILFIKSAMLAHKQLKTLTGQAAPTAAAAPMAESEQRATPVGQEQMERVVAVLTEASAVTGSREASALKVAMAMKACRVILVVLSAMKSQIRMIVMHFTPMAATVETAAPEA